MTQHQQADHPDPQGTESSHQTSRRGFIVFGTSVLASMSLPSFLREQHAERKAQVQFQLANTSPDDRANALRQIGAYGPAMSDNPAADIFRGSMFGILLASGKILTGEVLDHMGIEKGSFYEHSSQRKFLEQLKTKPIQTIIMTNIAAPILEEITFRLFPSQIVELQGNHGLSWDVGIGSNVLFALAHNITVDKDKPISQRYGFDRSSFSVPTFFSGLVFWYLQRTYGFEAATAAHFTNNATHQALNIAKLLRAATTENIE